MKNLPFHFGSCESRGCEFFILADMRWMRTWFKHVSLMLKSPENELGFSNEYVLITYMHLRSLAHTYLLLFNIQNVIYSVQ